MRGKLGLLCALAAVTSAVPAPATISVYLDAVDSYTTVGGTVDVAIKADIPEADKIVGWGLDLDVDTPAIGHVVAGSVVIGGLFDSVWAPDGDDLAGLVSLGSLWGDGIVLATVTLMGDQIGDSGLTLSDDAQFDFAEGFALDPSGLAEVSYAPGVLHVVPEPATLALVTLGGLALLRRRRP